MNSESQLIAKISRAVPALIGTGANSKLRLGIGDDAAIISSDGRSEWVLSCDAFLENVHFLAKSHRPDSVGYKSLVRATSDLAAMGATPRFFLLTLAIPANRTGSWLNGFLRGMGRAAREMGMGLIGGDTTKAITVSISITVLGEIANGRALTRAGAMPGDLIYVSGRLGRAQLGFQLIQAGLNRRREFRRVIEPHLYPRIKLGLGTWLAKHQVASSMMDISDGLSTDLARLCAASRSGARIWAERIPQVIVPTRVSKELEHPKLIPLTMALHGGEDYELLFTIPPSRVGQLSEAPGFPELAPIGEITRARKLILVSGDGREKPLKPQGWDPFRKS